MVQSLFRPLVKRGGSEVFQTLSQRFGNQVLPETAELTFRNAETAINAGTRSLDDIRTLDDLTEVSGVGYNIGRRNKMQNSINDTLSPPASKQLVTDHNKGQLESFIQENQQLLEAAPTGKMQTVEGEVDAKLFPGTPEELLEKASKYIRLREALHEAKVPGYAQSRAGWESVFGHVLDKEGYPMRLSGGTRKSKAGKKLTLVSTKSNVDRKAGLRSFSGNFEEQKKVRQWSKRELEGHHWETAAKEADIWSAKELPNGKIGRRSQEDIDYIEEGLRNRGITGIGDKGENLVGATKPVHMGDGLDETKPLVMHEIPKEAYDFEGIRDWAHESTDIYVKVPYGNQGKFKNKWFKNKDGIIYEAPTKSSKAKVIGDQKAFKKKYPKSKFLAFRMEGTRGTFAVNQKHGFSQEYVRNISQEDDPDKVIEAIATYYEAGIPEKRRGTSTVARRFLEKGGSDPQSEKMFFGAAADEVGVMEDLRQLSAYQQIPEFRQKVTELEEIARDLAGKNY